MKNARTILASAALGIAAIGSVAGLSACGGGGTPDATSILQSNGYTPVSLSSLGASADALTSSLPSGDVSSSAVGVKGSEYQFVIVATPQGQQDITNTGQLQNEENSASAVGVAVTYSGDVLTVTGTPAQLSSLPSS
jgi:hypothetical protein